MISSWLNKAVGVVQSPTLSNTSQQNPHVLKLDKRVLKQDSLSPKTPSNNNNNTKSGAPTQALVDQVVNLVLTKLDLLLTEQLGQPHTNQQYIQKLRRQLNQALGKLGTEANTNRNGSNQDLETVIVQTKEKYNGLVDTVNTNRLKLKQFHQTLYQLFQNFVIVQAQLLNTQQFQVPLKEVHRGIVDMVPEVLEKHLKLMCKLLPFEYEKAMQALTDKSLNENSEQLRSLRATLKKYELQMGSLKQTKWQLENQLKEITDSKGILLEKVRQSENNVKLAEQLSQQLSKEKTQQIQKQLMAKIAAGTAKVQSLQSEIKKLADRNSQLSSQISALNMVAEETKYAHRLEIQGLQKKHLGSVKKLNQQKLVQEEKYSQLNIKYNTLLQEQTIAIQKAVQDKLQLQKDLADKVLRLEKDVSLLEATNDATQQKMKGMVDKQVVRTMLEVYMDEGKPWQIKAEIHKKLMGLLSIKQKKQAEKPQPEQNNQQKKSGWFSSFF